MNIKKDDLFVQLSSYNARNYLNWIARIARLMPFLTFYFSFQQDVVNNKIYRFFTQTSYHTRLFWIVERSKTAKFEKSQSFIEFHFG